MSNHPSRKAHNLRADAASVLHKILEQGQSARECLPAAQLAYSEQDKAWLQEMVYGVLRQLPILQLWLRLLLDKPLKNRFKVVEHLIMLGFYQLAFSRVSTHAAVSETVSACQPLNTIAMKGLVNAVLRNFIRQEMDKEMPGDPQISSGLPKWIYKQLESAYPEQVPALVAGMQTKAPIWLRVNQKQISRDLYVAELAAQNIEFTLGSEQDAGLILSKGQDITTLPGYHQGWFAVQDGAAQLAAPLLEAKAGERILDCCAAPGGKTCHILELQSKVDKLIALDIDQKRLVRVSENLQRLGHQADLLIGDASQPAQWWDGVLFDRILLDAPCSATGVIRRHPDIKWLRKASDIATLVSLQAVILDAIWPMLKPGGTMLYATCSVLPQENHQQIKAFLLRTGDAKLDLSFENDAPERPGRQILPGEQQMDGFYYARLIKS
ncbi:MAG: 16S rRNA (cytosine967-C5)-methyltransferase [Paraglaciecola sp.]|jgi:16S rRNA (cytosine967-C5)-methyltransferase